MHETYAGPLFHYTTLNGFMGIVRQNTLWASDSLHMNDRDEREWGKKLILQILDDKIKSPNATSPTVAIIEEVKSNISVDRHQPFFILSFCDQKDILSMWRAYGNEIGICIEFSEMLRVKIQNPDAIPVRVEYDINKQETIIEKALDAALDELECERTKAFIIQNKATKADFCGWRLLKAAAYCKHPGFSEEREVRMVFPSNADRTYESKFRATSYGLTYYVEVHHKNLHLPIKSVTIGPHSEATNMKSGIEKLLMLKGHIGVPVEISNIPYRR